MADIILATGLLLGGLVWSFLVFAAMANSPMGGSNFAMIPFVGGLVAAGAGLIYWACIIAGWLF